MQTSSAIIETIQVMLRQEVAYASPCDPETTDEVIARTKMVDWCCRVISLCRLEIEVVAIAMNYADRMCLQSLPQKPQNSLYEYQLIVMTSLYIAAKVHAPEALDPKLVSNLSRQLYTPHQIEECERTILATLSYRVNPITAHSCLHPMFELLSLWSHVDSCTAVISIHEKEIAMKFAFQQIDAYTCNHHCSTAIRQSMVAYCAFMNALGMISLLREKHTSNYKKKNNAMTALYNFGYSLAHLFNINLMDDDDIRMLRQTQYLLDGVGSMVSPSPSMISKPNKCTTASPLPSSSLYKHQLETTDSMSTTNTTTNKRMRGNEGNHIVKTTNSKAYRYKSCECRHIHVK
jgi:Cyclin, N-terminal domain